MRRFLLLILLLVCLCVTAFGRGKVQGIAQLGGQVVATAGQSSTTKHVKTFPGCTITVYKVGTTTLATLYSDNAGTSKANPFTSSSSDASWSFFADEFSVDIRFSGTGINSPFTIGDVQIIANQTVFDIRTFGGACDGVVNAATSTNLANTAAIAAGGGAVVLPPGTCRFTSTITIGSSSGGGDGFGSFTGVSLRGANGLVGTTLQWAGATNGIAIKVLRTRMNNLEGFYLTSAVAKGATIGLQLTGAGGSGTQVIGARLDHVFVSGFNIGVDVGSSSALAASELHLVDTFVSGNNSGLVTESLNDTNIHIDDGEFNSNTTVGADVSKSNSVFKGTSFVSNQRDLIPGQGTTANTVLIGTRSEGCLAECIGNTGAAGLSRLTIIGSIFVAYTGDSELACAIKVSSVLLTITGSTFSGKSVVVYGGGNSSLEMVNNSVQASNPFEPRVVGTDSNGLRYSLRGNKKFVSDVLDSNFPDRTGQVVGSSLVDDRIKGSATFSAATTKTVTITTREASTYMVTLQCHADGRFWVTGQTTSQFVLNTSNAASTDTCDYEIVR